MKIVCSCSRVTLWKGSDDDMLRLQAQIAKEFGITAENIDTKLPQAESKYPGLSELLQIMEPSTKIVNSINVKEAHACLLDFVDTKLPKHMKFVNGLRHCTESYEGCIKH